MQTQSLFGHLVTRFSAQPENLATESLLYILQSSTPARRAFLHYLAQMGPELEEHELAFRTQAGKDGKIPDMVAQDREGKEVLILEAKFWAGLTDNQPVEYIKRLPFDRESIVLFLVPAKRLEHLWSELERRCMAAGIAVASPRSGGEAWQTACLESGRSLGITSWRSLLAYLLRAVEAEQQAEIASDVRQLAGLCEYMDETAFLPLTSEELTSNTGTRILQYCSLVDDVTIELRKRELVTTKGLKATASAGWYLHYMVANGFPCWLSFSARAWSQYYPTPLWFSVQDPGWKPAVEAKQRLARLETQTPSRLYANDKHVSVPLVLPIGQEREEVVESLIGQVEEILKYLA